MAPETAMTELQRLRAVVEGDRLARERRLDELRDLAAQPPAGEAATFAEVDELLADGALVEPVAQVPGRAGESPDGQTGAA
jgi:hypothetical protein